MFTWIMAANAAAWLMVALTLYSMGRFGFVANLFWGPLLMGAGAFTPFGLLARR